MKFIFKYITIFVFIFFVHFNVYAVDYKLKCDVPEYDLKINPDQLNIIIELIKDRLSIDPINTIYDVNFIQSGKKIILSGKVLTEEQKLITEAAFLQFTQVENKISNFPFSDIGEKSYGIVKLPILNMYKQPSNNSELLTQLLMGTTLKLINFNLDWAQVQSEDDNCIGWVENNGISMLNKDELYLWKRNINIIISEKYTQLYETNQESNIKLILYFTTKLKLLQKTNNDFYKVELPDNQIGYIKKIDCDFIDKVKLTPESIIKKSEIFLNTPYLKGGTTPLMCDSSGFIQTLFRLYGYYLPRNLDKQKKIGKQISKISDIKIGDILFFKDYTGIYLGNNKIMGSEKFKNITIKNLKENDLKEFNIGVRLE